MSGELILETNQNWKRVAPALLLSCIAAGALSVALLNLVHLEGMGLAVTAALVVYVLFRIFYPALEKRMPGGGSRTAVWTITGTDLTLEGRTIPLRSIKNVYCWPNRDALGVTNPGWTVNIETTGKNLLLRSLREGEEAERSALRLRALVVALGYEDNWPL